jgi:hypothetical protein
MRAGYLGRFRLRTTRWPDRGASRATLLQSGSIVLRLLLRELNMTQPTSPSVDAPTPGQANAGEMVAERHPGPWIGPDAELARACAMVAIKDYGTDDPDTHQRILKNGIWNDHVAVQAALAAIHSVRLAAPAARDPVTVEWMRQSEAAFEFIRLRLINNLDEPGRSAFWKAVETRDRLRALIGQPASNGAVGAWQWRYIGETEWKTPSGGRQLTKEELKRERPIEQRLLYASPSNPQDTVTSTDSASSLSTLRQAIIDHTRGDLFWIGEILLGELEKETGFSGEVSKTDGT